MGDYLTDYNPGNSNGKVELDATKGRIMLLKKN